MLTDKQMHETYIKMFAMIPEMEKRIREKYEKSGFSVYCVFLAVSDEEKQSYFLDLEIGGSAEKYKHIRNVYTTEEIEKYFM